MSSRRCFKARKTVKVVSYKGGKVNRRSTLTVPVKYDSGQNASTSSLSSISGGQYSCDSPPEVSFGADDDVGKTFHSKPKCGKLRLKKKINSYRNKKIRLGDAWLDVRNQLYLAALELQALPEEQYCIIPSCKEKACCRCLDCGPVHFMCDEHTSMIHAGGLTLHCPEIWKNNRYAPYKFGGMEVWNTEHNADHGYCRDIVVINKTGRQNLVKFKFCYHEPESVTLVRHGLWPASPKEPQAAFENGFMEILKYMFLECRASLKSICQAINWTMPTLSPVHIKDIYRLLVGETFGEYRYHCHLLDTFGGKNQQLNCDMQCPACPKENGSMFISLDALFGCVRKVSAGTSVRPPNHGETLFIEQSKVDSFLKNYQGKSSLKLQESCNNFQAGSSLRSKVKTKKLDETAIFGAGCRHEVPIKFFSLKRGEQIGNAVYLLKWLKQNFANLDIYLYYDIACTLESHLKKSNQEDLLENVKVAIPTFHCYGHKVSCQVLYSGRRIEGFGLSDGEVMERMWSYLRPSAKITKEMTPSHRVDALTDFLLHYGRKSVAQIGDRLCDHMKKAVHMKADTNDQLTVLLGNLTESGVTLNEATLEKWSQSEKELFSNRQVGKNAVDAASSTDVAERYVVKLKEYYDTSKKLKEINLANEEYSILSSKLNSMNEQLKKFENGQQRWSPDHPTFMLYINKAEASRRNELLCDMRGQCLERWFLLQLMRKYADGQAIAKKICGQITKTTNAIKKLVKQYGRKITEHVHSKYPPSVTFEEITDLNSTIWNCLEEEIECNSPVPYYIRRKIVDFQHIIHRCTEEVKLIKEEMTRVIRFYSTKISALQDWSDELKNESTESRGLLAMVLTKKDLINVVLQHLKASFSLYMDEDRTELEEHGDLPEEDRIFSTSSDDDEEEMELDDNGDGEDELEEDTLDLFISILNEEYGSDSDQSDVELSDDDLN